MCVMLKLGSRIGILVLDVDLAVQICFLGGVYYKHGRACEKVSVGVLMKSKQRSVV